MTMHALDGCDSVMFTEVVGEVFEHAPWVAQAVVAQRPFQQAQALHEAMLAQVRALPEHDLAARISDHVLTGLTGALSTHVLDTSRGCAAASVRLTLHELGGEQTQDRLLVEAVTDNRGRTAKPLLSGAPLRIGAYQLRFHMGDYFRATGAALGEWAFLEVVPVSFNVADPEGDYHVPLTVTPWSYSTYRGQ